MAKMINAIVAKIITLHCEPSNSHSCHGPDRYHNMKYYGETSFISIYAPKIYHFYVGGIYKLAEYISKLSSQVTSFYIDYSNSIY